MKNLGKITLTLILASLFSVSAFADKNVEKTSDAWLEAKLVTSYLFSKNVSLSDIDVDVRNQVAYLSGAVQSPVERELAEEIAKSVDGIRKVESKISIVNSDPSAKASMNAKNKEKSFAATVDDLSTTASIKTKFLTTSNVSGLDVKVSTDRGVVTLTGKVNSDAERSLAEQIAKNTDGVVSVNNMLEIAAK